MKTSDVGAAVCGLALYTCGMLAHAGDLTGRDGLPGPLEPRPMNFNRIAMLPSYVNNADAGEEAVSEIIAATADGMTLIYTDSPGEQIGFVDITEPNAPISRMSCLPTTPCPRRSRGLRCPG